VIENGLPGGGYLLRYGGLAIPFQVEHRDRKDLAISVYPELRLEVVAPRSASDEHVLARVQKRAGWIVRQWRLFEQYRPAQPERRYLSGETHRYLGRQYRLKVRKGTPPRVKLIGRFLQVWSTDGTGGGGVRDLLEAWYRRHAERVFAQRLLHCLEAVRSLRLGQTPTLTVHKMEKRWGSCTTAGAIRLNVELVKAPVPCIDYVIVHELCHLKAHNHGPEFYRLLGRCMPDWEARKDRLETATV
jgi:predicted metal-dependent hydrolase